MLSRGTSARALALGRVGYAAGPTALPTTATTTSTALCAATLAPTHRLLHTERVPVCDLSRMTLTAAEAAAADAVAQSLAASAATGPPSPDEQYENEVLEGVRGGDVNRALGLALATPTQPLSSHVFVELFDALQERDVDELEQVHSLWRWQVDSGYTSESEDVAISLFAAYLKHAQADVAQEVLTRGPLRPFWTRFVGELRRRDIDSARAILSEYADKGLPANVFTYTAIVRAYKTIGAEEAAWGVIDEMEADGVAPDTVTFNILMSLHTQMGDMAGARRVLDAMRTRTVEPSVITYNTLVNGYADSGDVAAAAGVLAEMEAAGCEPNGVTYNTLLDGYAHEGDVEGAAKLANEMRKKGVKLSWRLERWLTSQTAAGASPEALPKKTKRVPATIHLSA